MRNSRRKLMAAMLSPLLLGGCKFSRYFDVEWDEEVELFGGKIIIVHIKRGYERTSSIFDPDLRSIQRSVEITFDAGGRKWRFPLLAPSAGRLWLVDKPLIGRVVLLTIPAVIRGESHELIY